MYLPVEDRDDCDRRRITSYYERGESIEKLSRRIGEHEIFVLNKMKAYGIKIRETEEEQNLIISKYMSRRSKRTSKTLIMDGDLKCDHFDEYIFIRRLGKWILYARKVWEDEHGDLPKWWIIHHLNWIKLDDDLSNLTPIPLKSIHSSIHRRSFDSSWSKEIISKCKKLALIDTEILSIQRQCDTIRDCMYNLEDKEDMRLQMLLLDQIEEEKDILNSKRKLIGEDIYNFSGYNI